MSKTTECTTCSGTGLVNREVRATKCRRCSGTGKVAVKAPKAAKPSTSDKAPAPKKSVRKTAAK